MNRVQVGRLSVAEVLYRFVMDEALPGSGVEPETFWAGADALIHDFAPRNRELLARRDELQRASTTTTARARPRRPGFLPSLPELDRLPGRRARAVRDHDRERRSRGLRAGRAATGRAPAQRAFRHQRRQRPLGFALRRALRHRRHRRGRRARAGHVVQPGARRRGHRSGSCRSWTSTYLSNAGCTPTRAAMGWTPTGSRSRPTVRRAAGRSRRVRRLPRCSPLRRTPCSSCTTACTSRSSSTAPTRSARTIAPASRTCFSRLPSPRSWISRTPSRPSMPRTRCSGYRNWLRLMQGRLAAEVTKDGDTFTRALNRDRHYYGGRGSRSACQAGRCCSSVKSGC